MVTPVRKLIKQLLLRYGGYTTARKANARLEYRRLIQRYIRFIETGCAALPDRVILEPTQRCNLRCKMCFQDRKAMSASNELNHEQITRFFDLNPYLRKVTFIGGEVFVRHDIMDILRHLNRTRDIVICTNGTLIGEAEVRALKQFGRIYTICISLDGPREIHDSIRQSSGSYDKAVRAISLLAREIPVTVNLVIQGENILFMPDLIDLCASMQVKKVKIEMERIFSSEKRDSAISEFGLLPSDIPLAIKGRVRQYPVDTLRNLLGEARARGKRRGIDVYIDPPYLIEDLDACYSDTALASRRFICQKINTATLAPNGDLVHCLHIRKPFGNIMSAPLEEIWNSENAKAFRRRQKFPYRFAIRFFIPGNPAGSYAQIRRGD